MSHAAPSCAGFAPRHSTFGVTTQKFGMGEPRSFGHPVEGIDEDGKPVRSANKKENAELRVLERAMSVHDPSGRKTSRSSGDPDRGNAKPVANREPQVQASDHNRNQQHGLGQHNRPKR